MLFRACWQRLPVALGKVTECDNLPFPTDWATFSHTTTDLAARKSPPFPVKQVRFHLVFTLLCRYFRTGKKQHFSAVSIETTTGRKDFQKIQIRKKGNTRIDRQTGFPNRQMPAVFQTAGRKKPNSGYTERQNVPFFK